jgi:LPS O-antigen subunit length determinant protein (WzzB/FepE family)
MNDTNRNHYDDEIDLFEIVEILWQSKWIIIAAVFLSLVIATAYLAYKPIVYLYTVPYSSGFNIESNESNESNRLQQHLSDSSLSFSLDANKKVISLTSDDSLLAEAISIETNLISDNMTQALQNDARYKLQLLSDDTPNAILGTETAAIDFISANTLLNKINNGEKTILFQPVVKSVKSPKTSLVLALSVIGGGMMGLLLVFMLCMIAAYKKRQVAP